MSKNRGTLAHGKSPQRPNRLTKIFVVAWASSLLLLLLGCDQAATNTPAASTNIPITAPPAETSSPTLTTTLPSTATRTPTATATNSAESPSPTTTLPATETANTIPSAAPPGSPLGTIQEVLRVRSGPGTQFAILGKLAVGLQVILLARSADGQWFEIEYPSGSDQRGWINSGFVQLTGTSEHLPTAQAPPAPTLAPTVPATATLEASNPCAPIPDQAYGTLPISSGATERPAATHPDLNLELRGFAPTNAEKALLDLQGATDPGAPQLRWLFTDKRIPPITRTYQVYAWDWNAEARGPLIDVPEVTLLALQTTPGEIIATPNAGTNIGEGYVALVLYASEKRITLKYTREDHVVNGYTLQIENVCVEPNLLALYQQMNSAKRRELPALRAGQPLGRATTSEVGIVVRDKGTFMDPRSRKDWWTR